MDKKECEKDYKKDYKKILLVVIAIVLIGISLMCSLAIRGYKHNRAEVEKATGISDSSKPKFDPSKYLKESYIEKTSPNIYEQDKLYAFIYEYMENINEKDAESAFDMLWGEYVDYKAWSLDSFIEAEINKFPVEMTVKLMSYVKVDNYYICKLHIFATQLGEEDIGELQNKDFYREVTIVDAPGGYKLVLENISNRKTQQ